VAIPVNTAKSVITWALPGNEVAQTAFWWQIGAAPAFSDATAASVVAQSSFTSLMNAWKPLGSTSTVAIGFDQYGYTGGGGASSHGHATLLITGTGTSTHPDTVACVTTLRTAHPGRSGRGRMYWPANGQTMTTATGIAVNTNIDALVDALALFFTAQNTGTIVSSVVSQTLSSSFPITSVDADYVLDTQRRRSNKLKTTRHSHTV